MICNNNLNTPVYSPAIETYGQARVLASSPQNLTAYASGSGILTTSEVFDYNNFFTIGNPTTYKVEGNTTKLSFKIDLAWKTTYTSGAGSGQPAWYIDYYNVDRAKVQDTQVLARLNTYLGNVVASRVTTITETFNIKDYIFNSAILPPGTYQIRLYYIPQGVANFSVQLNPDSNNISAWEVTKVKSAGCGQVLDIPSNMPNGTSGIKLIDFIIGLQRKFNLVIYPSKLNPNQFIVETFNNWYKQGTIKDFNQYINVADPISYTPANQLGYKQIKFTDADDTDYVETLFKRTNNRIYGEDNFYDSGSYYSQGTLDVNSTVFAQGPLTQVPASVFSGSAANTSGSYTCSSYRILYNYDRPGGGTATYTTCAGAAGTVQSVNLAAPVAYICARDGTTITPSSAFIVVTKVGDCTPAQSGSAAANAFYPQYIPYYISDATYKPARVLPRLLFYNGQVSCSKYYIEETAFPVGSGPSSTVSGSWTYVQPNTYPYFDNYSTGSLNGTSSIEPQLDSKSLLFNNEQTVWGTIPTGSLVTNYWDKYLAMLYNPRTRLVAANAVIPLADYYKLELNDIAEFRGNYYHLRAINDYNLTTGEASIQLLGPIIGDTISSVLSGSWAPFSDICGFSYSASLSPCTTWNEESNKWNDNSLLWNCGS
jgi:hypothetical protein